MFGFTVICLLRSVLDRRRLNTQVLLTENVESSPRVFFLRVYYVRPMAEGATVKSPLVNVTCKTFQVGINYVLINLTKVFFN